MKVEIHLDTVKRLTPGTSGGWLMAFADGVKAMGDEPILIKPYSPPTHPVAVLFGYNSIPTHTGPLKSKRYNIIDTQIKNGRKAICMDGGVFATWQRIERNEIFLYRSAFNAPNNDGDFLNKNSPSDRWPLMKKLCNLDCKDWRTKGDHILLALQSDKGWSFDKTSVVGWALDTIKEIRKYSDRPIWIRQHPWAKTTEGEKIQRVYPDVKVTETSRTGFLKDLENCHALVTYNSTAAVDSIVCGIPSFVTNDKCMAWDVANKDLSKIENPDLIDRMQWLYDLSYCQWTLEEYQSGEVWKRFKEQV